MNRKQDLEIREDSEEYKIQPSSDLGSGKGKDKKEEFLSELIDKLNELFNTDELTDGDMLSWAMANASKIRENETVMEQIRNNSAEQAMLGDFPVAFDNAVMESDAAFSNQTMQIMSDPEKAKKAMKILFELVANGLERAAG